MPRSLAPAVAVLLILGGVRQARAWGKRQPADRAVTRLADDLRAAVPSGGRLLIADFADLNDRISHFGRHLADKVQVELASRKAAFTLVDRRRIELSLEEFGLQKSGLIDDDGATKMGKMLGATHIVYGTVTELDTAIEITLKLRDLEKGEVLAGSSQSIAKTAGVAALVREVLKSEAEKQAELDAARAQVARDIEEEKRALMLAINQEARSKRAQLASLESEIRGKSRELRLFEERQRELKRVQSRLDEINLEIDRAARIPVKLRIGMTRGEVAEVLTGQPVKHVAPECDQARQYFVLFEGDILASVVRLGAPSRQGGPPIRNCQDARSWGRNVGSL